MRKVALVTGGAKRVGRAIVERLVDAGFHVAFTYFNSLELAEDLASRLNACAICADLTDPYEAAQRIEHGLLRFTDRLDVLVHNASLYAPSSLQSTSVAQMRDLMAIHVESPLLITRNLAPHLRASRGHVVTMLDLLAERPWPEYIAYCASKAALWNLTLGLARELAPDVTVNGIAPGVVEWPEDYPETERAKYLKRVPLQRPGTPRDVADMVHFLVTSAPYLTGQILRLDGGRSLT